MPRAHIVKHIPIERTARVMQVEGIFDIAPAQRSENTWNVNLDLPETWNVGVIVGASGSGKTTVARELFGNHLIGAWDWDTHKSVLDAFPSDMSIKDITGLLSSVGFSSPPAWLRPFHVLSNGEQFRVNMARTLAEMPDLAVVDEFTSVVDRTVAQIGSAAIAKTVRKRNQRLIAVSCHYDILDWLEPDWVYEPATDTLYNGRSVHRRPTIELEVKRVHHSAWKLFRKHHYLDTSLNQSAWCFVAFWHGVPVAFTSCLHLLHSQVKNTKREHRTVVLPDYQGIGIGNRISEFLGALCKAVGFELRSVTTHPAMIAYRNHSRKWALTYRPHRHSGGGKFKRDAIGRTFAVKRQPASFRYVGEALPKEIAEKLLNAP